MNTKNKHDSVLEIGTEEIPVSFLVGIDEQLKNLIQKELETANLSVGEISVWASPRRLVLYLKDLPEENTPRTREIIGPPLSSGIKDGKYTLAALGFAKAHGKKEEDLKIKETPKGKYLYLVLSEKPLATRKILAEIYPRIISRIVFPKNMVWEETRFRFCRPIRWLLALYDDKIIKFSLAGLVTNRYSRGLAPDYHLIKIVSAQKYLTTLKNINIIVDHRERYQEILNSLKEINRTLPEGAKIKSDEELLNEINYLLECPTPVVGKFPEKYLQLPQEIILTTLRTKQKFLAVVKNENARVTLTNFFVGFRNGPSVGQENVRQGFERVLQARLEDAEFYFHQDQKVPFPERVSALGGISLPEGLGSLSDHIQRVKEVTDYLVRQLELKIPLEKLHRAIQLIKNDLTTGVVSEYPELQGIAGRIYAKLAKEDEEIARAIEEHYWPLTANSALPETEFSAILALADKVTTITGYWLSGIKMTGSADPYGLRRLSSGILRIIRKEKWNFSLSDLLDFVARQFPNNSESAIRELKEFFVNRLEQLFLNDGYRFDTIRATIAVRPLEVVDCENRLISLEEIRKSTEWENIEISFKRANNILRQAKYAFRDKPNPELFTTPAEKELFQKIQEIPHINKYSSVSYREFWKKFLSCRGAIDQFFNEVLVMAEQENIRNNRLALLGSLTVLTEDIADLTKLGGKQ